jgi:hypothetical protein
MRVVVVDIQDEPDALRDVLLRLFYLPEIRNVGDHALLFGGGIDLREDNGRSHAKQGARYGKARRPSAEESEDQ